MECKGIYCFIVEKSDLMTFLELITYFRTGGEFGVFCDKQGLDVDSELIEVLFKYPYDIKADLSFQECEKSNGLIENEVDGLMYHSLLDMHYIQDAVEESLAEEHRAMTDQELAERLFSYAVNDE